MAVLRPTRADSASSFSRFDELATVFFKTKFSDGLPLVNLRLNSCGCAFRCSRSAGRDFDRAQQLRTLAVWEQRSRSGDVDWSNDRVAETDGVSARRSELPPIRNGHRAGNLSSSSAGHRCSDKFRNRIYCRSVKQGGASSTSDLARAGDY